VPISRTITDANGNTRIVTEVQTVIIGAAQRTGTTTGPGDPGTGGSASVNSSIEAQLVSPPISATRTRVYWNKAIDN
jgi:hypothetical protein